MAWPARLEQVADHPLNLNQGTLYPALVRLEQKGWIKGAWQKTENNRDAKFYAITQRGDAGARRVRPSAGAASPAWSTSCCSTSHEKVRPPASQRSSTRQAEPDLAREVAAHLALLEDEFVRRGMTRDEAGFAAKRAFGGVALAKDRHRDARSFVWLDDARRDAAVRDADARAERPALRPSRS